MYTAEFCVINRDHPLSQLVDGYMIERIGFLYGCEDVNYWTRDKMWFNNDRILEVLMINDEMVGNLIYKTELSNEFQCHGIVNSLEVKSLYLFNADKNSGKGFGSLLFNRMMEISDKYQAKSIHVTVSEEVPDSLEFFRKKGFVSKAELPIRFKPNCKQYLLQFCK
ncbi:hypothetical protein Bhyg_09300 [Pseudolycoriella hygida]|uniref:N-acetyltransferase domain-containing protein n=1 Tax=Pseudolycoriella hygida TaxID=35572 RepID=A0A9Q0N681_9DIPT|nr:hypothetical protein Bhyg_09300 [Pseudolycoriella hygida]